MSGPDFDEFVNGWHDPCSQCHPELHRQQCWENGCVNAVDRTAEPDEEEALRERVARALCVSMHGEDDWDDSADWIRARMLRHADAALAVLRGDAS